MFFIIGGEDKKKQAAVAIEAFRENLYFIEPKRAHCF